MTKLQTTKQKEPDFGSGDYYKALGVEPDATPNEIRKAFRKLANSQHPDKDKGDAEEFKTIREAYDVLANPKLREKYDKYGRIDTEDAHGARNLINGVVEQIISGEYSLDTMDIVGSIKSALNDGIRQGISELDKRKKKLKRIEKNRHRTTDDLILRVFVKHIGVLKMEIEGIKTELRRLDIALYLIKDANYDFDAPEPVPQQSGIYFTMSGIVT